MSCAKYRGGMGFRDISSFNQALVAKQGWRLIQYPDSLVARVLKAKYFKNSHFLEAKTGSNSSFVWKSILWGRHVLQRGIRGDKIKIYSSNWLPRPMAFKPIVRSTLPADTRVSELIGPNHRWNKALI